jgi:hypothetical protein
MRRAKSGVRQTIFNAIAADADTDRQRDSARPARFVPPGGGGADCAQALPLPGGRWRARCLPTGATMPGYIAGAVAPEAVVPPRPNRREKRGRGRAPHRERSGIERMFA